MLLIRRKGIGFVLLLVAALLALGGCCAVTPSHSWQRFEFKQPHMGTLFTLTFYAPDEAAATAAAEAASEKIAALERCMTDYDPGSELMQLCQKPFGQPVRISKELFEVLQKAQRIAALSDGAFDVTIGPVVRLWRRARRTGVLPAAEMLAQARTSVGWQKLKLDARNLTATLAAPNMQLDLGGIGKGFAADKALEVLKHRGITRALVAASGDIAAGDAPPGERGWRVGIGALVSEPARSKDEKQQAGSETGASIAWTILLRNTAVSTAGDSEQFVEIDGRHYSHIVDPATGVGLTNRMQVSVVARQATDTDALDTTVRVMGVERGLQLVEGQAGMAALILVQDAGGTEALESSRWNRIPLAQPVRE